MVTSHGTTQGYNGQALVDSKNQVILHAEAFGSGQDHDHVPPILDGARKNVIAVGHSGDYFKGAVLTADTVYHSQTNLSRCEDEGSDTYIPDRDFRKRDPRFATRERHQPIQRKKFSLEDFHHDQSTGQYVCPGGKILRLQVKRWPDRGNIYRTYVAEETDCQELPFKRKVYSQKKRQPKVLNRSDWQRTHQSQQKNR